jgi:hypothetical protein
MIREQMQELVKTNAGIYQRYGQVEQQVSLFQKQLTEVFGIFKTELNKMESRATSARVDAAEAANLCSNLQHQVEQKFLEVDEKVSVVYSMIRPSSDKN